MESAGSCVFCRIAAGRGSATIVHEDDLVVAFRDINPVAPLHLLVVPREHVETLDDARSPELLGRMVAVGRDLARAHGVSASGYRVLINCRQDGGQVVYHLHLHVIGGRRLGPMA